MTANEAKKLAKSKLSEKRYRHTKNVVKAAKELAHIYGEDEGKAQLAAWLHDIVKEESREELLRRMEQDDIMAGSTAGRPYPVWHGPVAAAYAKKELGVNDEEVLSAIASHTTGKKNMSTLDKILFVADMISGERDFAGVGKLRKLAKTDLDKAVLETLESTVEFLEHAGKPVDEKTFEALQWMRR